MAETQDPGETFDTIVTDVLFTDAVPSDTPVLRIVLSGSVNGRSAATGRAHRDGALLNARDLEILAAQLTGASGEGARQLTAVWLQRALVVARERRVSVTVEGAFRSPELVSGLAQLFASAGYTTELWAVASRPFESRWSDASRRFDTHLRRTDAAPSSLDTEAVDVAGVVGATAAASVADRIVVLDRVGNIVVDGERDDPAYSAAAATFETNAARALGTLRSTLLLTELRRMTQLLTEIRSTPRWAVEDLVELHERALAEIIPELPVAVDSDARRLQNERLSAALAVLRNSVTSEAPTTAPEAPVNAPPLGPGLAR